MGEWINVNDRMPPETHSVFWKQYGTDKWNKAMWREQSDKVLVTVMFKNGIKLTTTGETHDGEWRTAISPTLEPLVTHWMQMPDPYLACVDCVFYAEGLRNENDDYCCVCTKMPSNDPAGCGYMEVDGIDHTKERMWFCPLDEHIESKLLRNI